mmetsp:Transcript_38337/g.121853  ORF Transcript_38337/g.121853 Transcript_38337/m.121853 type:complete len:219 (+) Transcript_38337:490-1146(+)
MQAASSHGLAEDPGEAREERRPPTAGEASSLPAGPAADLALERPLEVRAVAVVVHEVDVELVYRAVPGRVHDEGATCIATPRASSVHPCIVVANVAPADALHTGAAAPHLVAPLMPAAAHQQKRLDPVRGDVALGEAARHGHQSGHVCGHSVAAVHARRCQVRACLLPRALRHRVLDRTRPSRMAFIRDRRHRRVLDRVGEGTAASQGRGGLLCGCRG